MPGRWPRCLIRHLVPHGHNRGVCFFTNADWMTCPAWLDAGLHRAIVRASAVELAAGFGDALQPSLIEAIEKVGYSVPSQAAGPTGLVELSIQGMTCASCVGRVERALKAVSGVTEAAVNLASEQARIRYQPGVADPASVLAAIAAAASSVRSWSACC